MKLYNTVENHELIQQFISHCKIQIAKCKLSYSPWEKEWYEKIVAELSTAPAYFVYDTHRKKVVTIVTPTKKFDTIIWTADMYPDIAAVALQEKFPKGFFLSGDSYCLSKTSLTPVEYHASHDKGIHYPVIEHLNVWTNNTQLVTYFRDWLEKRYLTPPEDWQNKVEFFWGQHKMFTELLYDQDIQEYPWQRTPFGHYSYIGMHYTNWENNPDDVYYLLAMVNNKPIGCICVFDYESEQYGPKHYGMSYIDVATPYKKNGLAKRMIHELTKHLSNDKPLLLSRESREGAKCHIHECFKRERWPHSVMAQDDFDLYCRQQHMA